VFGSRLRQSRDTSPHENGNLELTLSLDHAEELGVLFKELGENGIVSRRIVRGEEASWCTLAAPLFLSQSSLNKPLLSRGSSLR
jgi:hypothetical protein